MSLTLHKTGQKKRRPAAFSFSKEGPAGARHPEKGVRPSVEQDASNRTDTGVIRLKNIRMSPELNELRTYIGRILGIN